MSQVNTSINNHIEEYLNYYCELSRSPKFAILLKGKWGSGKTWFLNQYREKLKAEGKKSLYVSLYGVANYSEIEDSLFQQLHPFLSSKGMVLAEKVFKGILKGALKIDLNNDGKEDGTWTVSIPDIKIPEKFKDSNFSLLIFDDLERCSISIEKVLGYINSFVESQDLKVVVIANEDEIHTKQEEYKRIKEKLIGKTFEILPDFTEALNDFLKQIETQKVKNILLSNLSLIQDLYIKAESKNLRILNQICLEFERIFEKLPEKAQKHPELIKEVLEVLIIFSIEISSGRIKPQDISQIEKNLLEEFPPSAEIKNDKNAEIKENTNEKKPSFTLIFNKYYNNIFFTFNRVLSFPSLLWWERFFDKGIVDKLMLDKELPNSKYFQDENTAPWIKLWYFTRHSDENFRKILNQVESQYIKREFEDIGIIKHITGLFLQFSKIGLYNKSKLNIIDEAKKYIDELKLSDRLDIKYRYDTLGGYMGLGFQCREDQEFKNFWDYINQSQKEVLPQKMSNNAKELLDIMRTNISEFRSIICITAPSNNLYLKKYHNFPIFYYLAANDFMQAILISPNENISSIFSCIEERYRVLEIAERLVEELDFLREVQKLLLAEVSQRKGDLSGYLLNSSNDLYLKKAISNLEQTKNSQQGNIR